jgi:hypothetical protein
VFLNHLEILKHK